LQRIAQQRPPPGNMLLHAVSIPDGARILNTGPAELVLHFLAALAILLRNCRMAVLARAAAWLVNRRISD
jgi:hypothetical protein